MKTRSFIASAGLIAVFSMLMSAQVESATVSGHVSLASMSDARSAVIYLTGDFHSVPLQNAKVDQCNRMFMPHITVVTVGTVVQFPNDDTVFHNVFAYFRAKKFDLGTYPRGASKSVEFDKPGVVALLCNIHPDMSAYIMVVDTPYYAVATEHGDYEIKDVPPGAYSLHAWHESGQGIDEQVTVMSDRNSLPIILQKK